MKPSWAAIFDFDGVIVDTEWHHEVCWQAVAKERKQGVTHEQYVSGFGVKNERFIREILAWTKDPSEIEAVSKRKEQLFQEHIAQETVSLIPGVDGLLQTLHEARVPCAIASSSILKNIELLLKNSPIRGYFSFIVSGENVREGKPNPECFLQAANGLKIAPEQCVVFEDALLGVEAAKRAGCKAVAITTTFDRSQFEGLSYKADKIIDTFSELNLNEIESWFA